MESQNPKKIRAAMDIGTNSTRLLIAAGDEIIHQETTITRIGEGLKDSQKIQPEPLARTIKVLKSYKEKIAEIAEFSKTQKYSLVATSAMRDALNKDEVLKKIKEETGFQVEIISGEKEAELSYIGATGDFPGKNVVIDIGGGSTEVIFQDNQDKENNNATITYTSTNLGGVRLKENQDLQDGDAIKSLFSEKIPIKKIISHESNLIGVGGTITTIAAVKLGLEKYDWKKIHGLSLTLPQIKEIHEKLEALPLEERKKVPGLQPERADIITFGTKILITFMEEYNFNEIKASDKDLLFALLKD